MKTIIFCLLLAGAFASVRRFPSYDRERSEITGGKVADPGQFPFQLSYQRRLDNIYHICGASIYTESIAICAAHCVVNEDLDNPQNIWIVAGEQSLSVSDPVNEQERKITKMIPHEKYNGSTIENDISLLFWDTPLIFNARVQPVILPSPFAEESGNFLVSGWGTTSSFGTESDLLLYVSVPFVNDTTCKAEYADDEMFVAQSMICAGETYKDSCKGDSGGPLSQDGVLVGIVSWGFGCGRSGYPGVYTQVSYFVDWIKANSAMVN